MITEFIILFLNRWQRELALPTVNRKRNFERITIPPRVERERWQRVSRGGLETLGTAFPIKNGPLIVRLTARLRDFTTVFHGSFSETVPDTFVFPNAFLISRLHRVSRRCADRV